MAIRALGAACLLAGALLGGGVAGASDDALQALGARLFHDKRLSANGSIACASCHVPEKAFSDGKPVAEGIDGRRGTRNTPSLAFLSSPDLLLWDGRRKTLEEQVLDPLVNPNEHGFRSIEEAVARLNDLEEYRAMSAEGLTAALSAVVRSLPRAQSPFDRFRRGESQALSASQRRGLELFQGRGRCDGCHSMQGSEPPFTDNRFHSLSTGERDGGSKAAAAVRKVAAASASQVETLITNDAGVASLGRFNVTRRPSDIGKFRTPSLRNVAMTAPYMHDGSVATLEEAVELELYYRGAHQGRPIVFTADEKSDLVAFLKSLTSEGLGKAGNHP